jgi:hypothetical protein
MSSRKQQLLEKTAPKWGDEAAEYRWKMMRIQMTGLPLALLGGASLVVQGELGWALLAVFVLVGAPLAVLIFVYLRRMNLAASETLGVRVTGRADSAPPNRRCRLRRMVRKERGHAVWGLSEVWIGMALRLADFSTRPNVPVWDSPNLK